MMSKVYAVHTQSITAHAEGLFSTSEGHTHTHRSNKQQVSYLQQYLGHLPRSTTNSDVRSWYSTHN
jgi:hypothetical protein